MISNFPAVLNFNRLFLKLNQFICNQLPVLPGHSCRLHVDILRICFHSFEVYSIDSSEMIRKIPGVSNSNRLFLNLNVFMCN